MKAINKAAVLQGRLAEYEKTCATRRDDGKGFNKPGAGANSFGHQGPGKKKNRVARTQVIHQRLRDLSKQKPENQDLRRYA